MNRCKKILSQFLILTMLFSVMMGTASAEEIDANEASKAISISCKSDYTYLKTSITVAEYDQEDRSIEMSSMRFLTVSAPDREYTVENVGGPQDCYLYIGYYKYQATTGEKLREEYKNKVSDQTELDIFPDDDTPVYVTKQVLSTVDEYFLTTDNTWCNGISNPYNSNVRRIEEGEKITFTLPDAAEDDMYRLFVYAYYPFASGRNKLGMWMTQVLIDTDQVYPGNGELPESNISIPVRSMLEYKDIDALRALGMETGPVKSLLVMDIGSPLLAAPGQVFTLTHTGKAPRYSLSVRVIRYVLTPASELRKEYKSEEISDLGINKMPTDATGVYYCYNSPANIRYLMANSAWSTGVKNYEDNSVLRIASGESVSFTLPNAEDGVLYEISIYTGSTTVGFYVLVDETAAVVNDSQQEETPVQSGFTDVPLDSYYARSVAWAVKRGITTGTTETTFSPNTTCTKAQILTFLWRANGSPVPTLANPFSDVSEENYFYQAALWAHEKGLVEGDVFGESQPCTRAMTVTYLWKLAGSPEAEPGSFSDVDSTAEYAAAVAWAVSEGITNGTGETTFSPLATCTRAQIVTLLYRAMEE